MKKIILLFTLLVVSISVNGQQIVRPNALTPAESNSFPDKARETFSVDQEKTFLCQDTIRYPQVKEQLLNPVPAFYLLDIWQADNEAITQTFLLSGSTLSVKGVEFFGANNTTDGTASVTVRASIYSVNASYQPTTQLATGTVTFSSTTAAYYYVNFASPINVTANYAVVIEPISTDGVIDLYVSDIIPGQAHDELLTRYKSTYYTSSSGAWITIPQFTELGNYNFEPIVAPIVSYTMNTTALASPDVVCQGTPIAFTSTATPTSILTNRMYNFNVFYNYFGVATSDSTYVWDMDNLSPYIWSASTSYTYPTAGIYDPTMYVLGGFWNSCVDYASDQVTVNALPVITANATSSNICSGTSTTLSATGGVTYTWDNGIGTVPSPVVSPSTTTTYQVTGTNANNCTASSTVTINVTQSDDATFTYAANTFCTSGTNETPIVVTPGTFTTSDPGLVFVSTTTGEINVSGSTDGTYTVTYTTSGVCPSVSSQTITITTNPDATFTYAQASYCSSEANPSPVFGVGTSAGTFSSTAGLVFVSTSTGVINLASSTAGTYIVTNTIAASGSCPMATATFSVTINTSPSAVVTGGGTMCGDGTTPIDVFVAMSGAGPWNITYFDGTSTFNVLNQASSPYVIQASTSGTYTVTNISNANCSAIGTGTATVVFNPNPTVTITPVGAVCDNDASITLSASPSGGTFSGTGVTGDIFDPAQAGGVYTITYTYVDANSCSGSASTGITVNESPTVSLGAFTAMCMQDSPLTLSGGLPAGGTFSGSGVSAGQFDPAIAGVGSQTITYTFVDANSCSSAATQTIIVNDCAGIEELAGTTITLAPNPTSNQLYITVDSSDEIVWNMVTEDGKIVIASKAIENGTETIDVSNFAHGVYFLQFNSSNGSMTKKVIIQ